MYTENGVQVDYEALEKILREADVVTVGFTFTNERLLVDTRSNEVAGPLVTPVMPVNTVQERYLWLGQHRPSFGAPSGFSFFVWPLSVRTLRHRDALGTLRERLRDSDPLAADALEESLAVFAMAELESARGAIRGEHPWATVWSAQATRGRPA